MTALRILVLCFMACACTGILAQITKKYSELVWNKVTFILYCIYILLLGAYTLVFWIIFFTAIAPYIR